MTFFMDLDGTIINSFKRHSLLLQNLIDNYYLDNIIDVDNYEKYKRNGYNNFNYLTDVLLIDEICAKKIQNDWIREIESSDMLKCDFLYDDVLSFLNYLKEMKYNVMCLTKRSNIQNVVKELHNLKIYDFFDNIYVVNDEQKFKSKDQVIEYYKKKMNFEKNIVIIGDTEIDYDAAIKTNVSYYILNRGFRSDSFLKKRGVKVTYSSLNDVKEVLSNDRKL